MNLEGHYDWRTSPPKLTLSSLILLVIFVAAAGFVVGAVLERPWADGATSPAAAEEGAAIEAPALSDATAR